MTTTQVTTDEDRASAALQEWTAMLAEMGDLFAKGEYLKLEALTEFFQASVKDSADTFGMLAAGELEEILQRRGAGPFMGLSVGIETALRSAVAAYLKDLDEDGVGDLDVLLDLIETNLASGKTS